MTNLVGFNVLPESTTCHCLFDNGMPNPVPDYLPPHDDTGAGIGSGPIQTQAILIPQGFKVYCYHYIMSITLERIQLVSTLLLQSRLTFLVHFIDLVKMKY